ncbi:aldo/keto reductase [Aestuariibius sp. 2305UL40-4]|uniref:aldo/keto reductase n=1 Tax=Aestuariibius violaceus TaxID=3234132 RepID=UPI00345EEFEA
MMGLTTRSGAPVSRFAYGAMQWGGRASEDDAAAMYRACRAAGISHFDTAHAYTDGASERMLGALVGPERDAVFVATKVAYEGGSGRGNILGSFSESRERLGLEVVDLLYLHRWDGDAPLEETFSTLAELQEGGSVRYLGVSNFAAWQVMKAQVVAERFGTRIDAIQPMMNLVKRQVEVEILPMAADQGIAVFPYSPLGGGLLTGKYAAGGAGRLSEDDRYAARYGLSWMREAADGLARTASEVGVPAATLAVAWLARHAPEVGPILSARTAEQLEPSLAGMTFAMDDALYERITALSPAPPPATDRIEEA